MSTVTRRIITVLITIVIVIVVLLVGVLLFLGPIIKTATQQAGSRILGAPITVEKVTVDLLGGGFGLKKLRVGNPTGKGYSDDPAFAVDELRVAVKIGSLPGSDPIEVKEVTIIAPRVSYEVVNGLSNIDAMLKNLQGAKKTAAAEEHAKKEAAVAEAKPAKKEAARKVIIDRFEFNNGELSYRAGITFNKAIRVPLPPVTATDIGKSSNGTSMEDALNRMFMEVASDVGNAVVNVTDAIGKGLKAGGGVINSGSKAGSNAVKSVTDAIKGLF